MANLMAQSMANLMAQLIENFMGNLWENLNTENLTTNLMVKLVRKEMATLAMKLKTVEEVLDGKVADKVSLINNYRINLTQNLTLRNTRKELSSESPYTYVHRIYLHTYTRVYDTSK